MAEFRRLISYIYEYEGNVKGKNVGFVKLETRNGMCRLSVSVKKLYMGSGDMGVYLLTGRQEIFLGNLFLRNGCGEFRAMVQVTNVQESGETMDECYGLTLHGKSETWRVYTTIWEDAVAQAAQLTLETVTSENVVEQEVERGKLSSVVPDLVTGERCGAEEKEAGTAAGSAAGASAPDRGQPEPLTKMPKAGTTEMNIPGMEMPKIEAPGVDTPEIETPGVDTPEVEVPGVETPGVEIPGAGTPKTGALGVETPGIGAPGAGTPKTGALGVETPGIGAPGAGTPKTGALGVETPGIGVPGAGTPKTGAWGVGTPGIEAPKTGTPEAVLPGKETAGKSAPEMAAPSDRLQKEPPAPQIAVPDHEMGRLEMETGYPDIPLEKAVASGLFSTPVQPSPATSSRPVQGRERPGQTARQVRQPGSQSIRTEEQPPLVIRQYEEEPLIIGDPQALAMLDEQEAMEKLVPVWDFFANTYPKIQAFDSEHGCQVLVIKPQDIGFLPREIWIYGNNSFLLHGYYNYRYLILARLEDPRGLPRYLLGVPGHYYSNEKYMASMFGFPHFVLSKRQPAQDGRFGYWYTDIRMEENAVLGATAVEKARKMAY